jgi:hypothetical protein
MFYFLLKLLLTEITVLATKDMVATFFKYYVTKIWFMDLTALKFNNYIY